MNIVAYATLLLNSCIVQVLILNKDAMKKILPSTIVLLSFNEKTKKPAHKYWFYFL